MRPERVADRKPRSHARRDPDDWSPLRRRAAPLRARIAVRVLAVLARLVVCGLDVCAWAMPARLLAPVRWPKPSGPYAVGVRDLDRPAARVWYPAVAETRGTAPLLTAAEAAAIRTGSSGTIPGAILRQMQTVRTASVPDAALLAPAGPGWPLLIFSHGLGGYAAQNTALCEELASHGYFVVALTHATGSAAARQADGSYQALPRQDRAKALDPWLYVCAGRRRRARDRAAQDEASRCLARIESLQVEQERWVADIRDALDGLAGSNAPAFMQRHRGAFDLGRVGLIGMSFGGSASAAAACVEPRIGAVVNLDGGQIGPALYDAQIRVPLLVMQSGAQRAPDGSGRNDSFYEPIDSTGRSGTVLRFRVEGSAHLSYSDLVLFGRGLLRRALGTGTVTGERMHRLVAGVVRPFCDRYVKGDAAAFDPPALEAGWPELHRHRRSG